MWVRDAACTASRMLAVPGSGLATTVQAEPFQCSMRVWGAKVLESLPTAQASHAETTATPLRLFAKVPGFGGGTPVQFWQVDPEAPADPGPASAPVITSEAASSRRARPAGNRAGITGTPYSWISTVSPPQQ